jgi:type II secretory pathway pseudopilin PulG
MQAQGAAGLSFAELLFSLGLMATIGAAAVPQLLAGLDESRTRGAARYVAARLQHARIEAVARSANTAIRFTPMGTTYTFSTYVDGDRDGVSSRDIVSGTDTQTGSVDALALRFSGVDFGLIAGLPAADGTSLEGMDPIRFGSSRMVSFSPDGTATAGSLYIRGRRGAQYVVRVFGDTGKTQALRFDQRRALWVPL